MRHTFYWRLNLLRTIYWLLYGSYKCKALMVCGYIENVFSVITFQTGLRWNLKWFLAVPALNIVNQKSNRYLDVIEVSWLGSRLCHWQPWGCFKCVSSKIWNAQLPHVRRVVFQSSSTFIRRCYQWLFGVGVSQRNRLGMRTSTKELE